MRCLVFAHLSRSRTPFYSIQFSLFYFAQYHKFASEGLTICTHRHPCPRIHIGSWDRDESGKTPPKIEKPFHGEKREETFRRATED